MRVSQAVNELIELVGRDLHEMTEEAESHMLKDLAEEYEVEAQDILVKYDEWRKEYDHDKDDNQGDPR